jgi:hypothetical protein
MIRSTLRSVVWTVTTLTTAAPLAAQSSLARTEAELIAKAERDGASFPPAASPSRPGFILPTFERGSDRRCVEGTEAGPVRSGEFVIGGQLGGSKAMTAGRVGKVWWAPLNHSLTMGPLLVRGWYLGTPADSMRFTSSNVAWPVTRGAPPIPDAEREYFFPSGISLPRAGRWLVVATSDQNWGCFIISAK